MPLDTFLCNFAGGGPRVVVSTAAFHSRVQGLVPSLSGLKETQMFECSASDRQGSNFESCVWRTVSAHSYHHPQEVLLARFNLVVHKFGLKSHSFIHSFVFLLKLNSCAVLCISMSHAKYRNVVIVVTQDHSDLFRQIL